MTIQTEFNLNLVFLENIPLIFSNLPTFIIPLKGIKLKFVWFARDS